MAYNAVPQGEHDALGDDEAPSYSPLPPPVPSHAFQPLPQMDIDNSPSSRLFMDHQHEPGSTTNAAGLGIALHRILSHSTKASYEVVEDDDYSQHSQSPSSVVLSVRIRGANVVVASNAVARDKHQQSTNQDQACGLTQNRDKKFPQVSAPKAQRIAPDPPLRTASGRRAPLRHPTPDLQALQGAFMANVEHLEKTAEKLSMTSSIEDAIRQLHDVQKRSDSRQSSLLASPIDLPLPNRQFSNSSSIVDVNNAARSGGFSPGGFNVISPREPSSSTKRSSSKGSKFGTRPEPELEGRPLDSFANFSFSGGSPALSLSASIAQRDDSALTLTQPSIEPPPTHLRISNPDETDDRPTTSASAATFDQAERLFSDFDGEHFAPIPHAASEGGRIPSGASESGRSAGGSQLGVGNRLSSGNRLSMARPQSYADPGTGQQMVYYPAPVPMMLNLPQKISRLSQAEAARAKRRSQILSSMPTASRQSALWLPDVLEDEGDTPEEDSLQKQEYLAQHQRATMGGRRSTQDLQHLPPQLRASAFFDVPGASQLVEVKEESAVKTLDSILDASAYAPVSAFTDHLIAGKLGAEVYGNKRVSRPLNQLHEAEGIPKRKSFADILKPRRTSSSELLGGRRTTTWGRGDYDKFEAEDDGIGRVLRLEDGDLVQDEEEEEEDEEVEEAHYEGAPTTLLAELQLRKQRQKERTRPVVSAYPNGMHSTLLELDAVAQVEKKSRGQKRVNLAWEDPSGFGKDSGDEGDEDVPLAMLFPGKSRAHQDQSRPMGLMERREMEDNEPLSRRRDRLQGRPRPMPRASTMMGYTESAEDEGETLAQRVQRLRAQGGTATGLPAARPVSGDFTSELMSQFGGDMLSNDKKGKGKELDEPSPPEEEETLGQRRKRLQAEREAREKEVAIGATTPQEERPTLKKQHSMADILAAHPSAGAGKRTSSYGFGNEPKGLLGLHEKQSAQRSSTMLGLQNPQLANKPSHNAQRTQSFAGNNMFVNAGYQQGYPQQSYPMTAGAGGFGNVNPYGAMGGGYGYNGYGMQVQNPMAAQMLQMQQAMAGMGVQGVAPLNQGQIDMVERWRQSVMH